MVENVPVCWVSVPEEAEMEIGPVTAVPEKPEEEEIEDTSNLVELENMDSVIQEAIEKNVK